MMGWIFSCPDGKPCHYEDGFNLKRLRRSRKYVSDGASCLIGAFSVEGDELGVWRLFRNNEGDQVRTRACAELVPSPVALALTDPLEAQARFPTELSLHNVIVRSLIMPI